MKASIETSNVSLTDCAHGRCHNGDKSLDNEFGEGQRWTVVNRRQNRGQRRVDNDGAGAHDGSKNNNDMTNTDGPAQNQVKSSEAA